ncbi:MAG: hypothetical protein MH825_05225 [Cyanobacteria bacterium]|nr:hypothetical protein [Cyanobacteriota bacterium]
MNTMIKKINVLRVPLGGSGGTEAIAGLALGKRGGGGAIAARGDRWAARIAVRSQGEAGNLGSGDRGAITASNLAGIAEFALPLEGMSQVTLQRCTHQSQAQTSDFSTPDGLP